MYKISAIMFCRQKKIILCVVVTIKNDQIFISSMRFLSYRQAVYFNNIINYGLLFRFISTYE